VKNIKHISGIMVLFAIVLMGNSACTVRQIAGAIGAPLLLSVSAMAESSVQPGKYYFEPISGFHRTGQLYTASIMADYQKINEELLQPLGGTVVTNKADADYIVTTTLNQWISMFHTNMEINIAVVGKNGQPQWEVYLRDTVDGSIAEWDQFIQTYRVSHISWGKTVKGTIEYVVKNNQAENTSNTVSE